MDKQYKEIHFTLNGKPRSELIDVRLSLADLLRDHFGLTSVKKGCEVGECGACTALVNNEAMDSCIYLAIWADGKDIVTLEGLEGPNGELSDLQRAFVDQAAVQCGFCTPGFIMAAEAALRECSCKNKKLSREEMRTNLAGNLCRCTGYENIVNAVEQAQNERFGEN